jgi:thiol-disulfide isomerase/thioredoxin
MKKILQSVAVATTMLFATNASAQLPNGGIYSGGLVLESYAPSTSYGGTHIYTMGSWDVDSILASGTPVILDLFATWCGPCWSYHQAGTLEALYDSQGWGGPNNVAIFAVEADGNTVASKLEGGDAGDWITDTKYPMVNNDGIASMFNLAYYPTIVMICPDGTVTEVGQTTEANFTTALQGCSPFTTLANDPRIVANGTDASVISCGSAAANADVIVTIQNNSATAINATYTVKLYDGATEIATNDVVLNLDIFAAQDVTVGNVAVAAGVNNYTVKITTANDDLTNDEIAVAIEGVVAQEMAVTDNTVNLDMNIDGYGSEIGVVFDSGLPTGGVVATYNNVGAAGLGYMAIGTLADGDSFIPVNYTLDAALGCHYFMFADNYGDGITDSNYPGTATISTTAGGNLVVDGDWGQGTFVVINFVDGLGIESTTIENLTIFPNPANDVANVSLTLSEVSNVSISLVNTLGQTVYNTELGNVNGAQNVQINTTDLESGMYLVNTTVNGVVSTDRISIVK